MKRDSVIAKSNTPSATVAKPSSTQKVPKPIVGQICTLCGDPTTVQKGYERTFFECGECGFLFTKDYDSQIVNMGMGMEGSWTGPGGGGYREYYLATMLAGELKKNNFLLFGTGNTPAFEDLRKEGYDVVGCDISQDVVAVKTKQFGKGSFFVPEDLTKLRKKFDVVIAVEVFEHFVEPEVSFDLLVSLLNEGGIICGTTDFYPGNGQIEDGNKPGYMELRSHVSYWNSSSLGFMAKRYGLALTAFEMIRPGSVLPDEKYGQLYRNKRVFFLYDPKLHQEYFDSLKASTPILPIDRP